MIKPNVKLIGSLVEHVKQHMQVGGTKFHATLHQQLALARVLALGTGALEGKKSYDGQNYVDLIGNTDKIAPWICTSLDNYFIRLAWHLLTLEGSAPETFAAYYIESIKCGGIGGSKADGWPWPTYQTDEKAAMFRGLEVEHEIHQQKRGDGNDLELFESFLRDRPYLITVSEGYDPVNHCHSFACVYAGEAGDYPAYAMLDPAGGKREKFLGGLLCWSDSMQKAIDAEIKNSAFPWLPESSARRYGPGTEYYALILSTPFKHFNLSASELFFGKYMPALMMRREK